MESTMSDGQYQVVELYDVADATLPRYVWRGVRASAWRVTWENQDKLAGKLAGWFRQLAAEGREPTERVLLGEGIGADAEPRFRWRPSA